MLDAAAGGLGIALVRRLLVQRQLEAGQLLPLFNVECGHHYSYWMVWNPASPKLEAIEKLRTWIAEELHGASLTR